MDETYLGVFYTIEASLNNTQGTTKVYSYVWELDRGNVITLKIDESMRPVGLPQILIYATFDMRYSRDEAKSKSLTPPPKPRDVQSALRMEARQGVVVNEPAQSTSGAQLIVEFTEDSTPKKRDPKKDLFKKAEAAAKNAFDQGLEQLKQGLKSHAITSLEKPLLMPVPWEQEHKHMFSWFGTMLRKKNMFDLSLRHHARALSLAPKDVNIMFNLARVHSCMGEYDKAEEYLMPVLLAAPEMEAAFLLQEYIDKSRAKQQNHSNKMLF